MTRACGTNSLLRLWTSASIRLQMLAGRAMFAGCVMLAACAMLAGCASSTHSVVDRTASRISFSAFHVRSKWDHSSTRSPAIHLQCGQSPTDRALHVMGLSKWELDCLMRSSRGPQLHEVCGQWKGINKGLGPALAAITQDIKVLGADCQFESCDVLSDTSCDHNQKLDDACDGCVSATQTICGRGYNIQVHQVGLCDLECHGFKPVTERGSCEPKTMGNFVIHAPAAYCKPMLLDYTAADNPLTDPSRVLIDEIVVLDDNLLLGRANIKLRDSLMPIAYFVLYR